MKHLSLLSILLFAGLFSIAQQSLTFPYQALVRDATGIPVANQQITAKITLMADSLNRQMVFEEEHSVSTNGFGQLELQIGSENPEGFDTIPWAAGSMFIKLEVDLEGGTNFQEIGTHQLLAVPYAKYAEEAAGWMKIDSGISYTDDYIGIGNDNPDYMLDILGKSNNQNLEKVMRIGIDDAPDGHLIFGNATGNPGTFLPLIEGMNNDNDMGSLFLLAITNAENDSIDNDYRPLMWFDARRTNGYIQNRPLFRWSNFGLPLMTMKADGNLGIGTTNPGIYKLKVEGQLWASNMKTNSLELETYLKNRSTNLPFLYENIDITEIQSIIEQDSTIDLGKMNMFLLEKIDQLIQSNIHQKMENRELHKKYDELQSEIEKLKNK